MKRWWRKLFHISCILLLAAATNSCPDLSPGTSRGTIQVGHLTRTFWIHVPPTYTADSKWPLVIALHPFTGSGRSMMRVTRFNAIADREGFIVAYPDGRQRVWNANPDDPSSIFGKPANDVAFIDQLIDTLVADYGADPGRVYITGASAGGLMAHRIAGELTDKLAAAASVMITLPKSFPELVKPSKPLPFLMIHGKSDPFFPWDGGVVDEGPSRSNEYLSVADSLNYWIANNGAAPDASTEELPNADPNDGTTVFCERHEADAGGAEVVLYGIRGGGHTWPGGSDIFPEFLVGKTSQDLNASEAIWSFFAAHTRTP